MIQPGIQLVGNLHQVCGVFVCVLYKGLFKRMQHVGPTSFPFEHHVGYCCIMLDDVGSSLILFKLFIQHRPTFDEKLVQRHRFHGDLH